MARLTIMTLHYHKNNFHYNNYVWLCHTCRVLPAALVVSVFGVVVICSNYKLVKDTNDCSCWCLPTLGNVLPLAIAVDSVSSIMV